LVVIKAAYGDCVKWKRVWFVGGQKWESIKIQFTLHTLFELDYSEQLFPNQSSAKFLLKGIRE
jgi:hypothetical protein